MTKTEMQAEALANARAGQSVMNYSAIFEGFISKGIAEADIKPRENVFTFHAWKALGRSVKKGQHGVKVVTFIECSGNERDPASGEEKAVSYRRPHTTTVFHISQTEPTSEREARQGHKPWHWSEKRLGSTHGDYVVPDPGELAADRWDRNPQLTLAIQSPRKCGPPPLNGHYHDQSRKPDRKNPGSYEQSGQQRMH